jgi:GWxTD domain-containing protein
MTPAEKKLYATMNQREREKFEEEFWNNKSIGAEEYFRRMDYIDAVYGASKAGSGANTDPGRVYLSLGPPSKVTQIPSSRILVPLEIWYYDTAPGLLNTELRLIFFRKRSSGLMKLYSPTLDTMRALLLPQASLADGVFGPNDDLTEAALRKTLTLPPSEDEVITAAVNVAPGIKYSGNDEVLAKIQSPEIMLRRDLRPLVESKFVANRPKLDVLLSKSPYGGMQADFSLLATAKQSIGLEVLEGVATTYQNVVNLKFDSAQPVHYLHRLDLLPGSYRVLLTVDGRLYGYPLEVPLESALSDAMILSETSSGSRQTPFEFEDRCFAPDVYGNFAVVALPDSGEVSWTVRRGLDIVWRAKSHANSVAILPLAFDGLTPGKYDVEASFRGRSSSTAFFLKGVSADVGASPKLVSYNANLSPASREAFIGHGYLLRGRMTDALFHLNRALGRTTLPEAQVDLARIDAMSGRWDEARARLKPLLSADPNRFDALCVFAYVEAQLQDYEVAAEYYRRALSIHDSPALRIALAQLHW